MPIPFTFGLLGLSIGAAWLPSVALGKRYRVPPWSVLFLGAVIAGLASGFLDWPAIAGLAIFGGMAYGTARPGGTHVQRMIFGAVTAVLALALAMHRMPGFHNPILIAHHRFSADAAPFTQYANFDKAAVGLILLAFLCARVRTVADWKEALRRAVPVALTTAFVTIVLAILVGFVRFEPKLPPYTPVFLATNLLFICVAEEAFFCGFLQACLAKALAGTRFGQLLAVLCSGVAFGLAHAAGGSPYVLLATVSGLGSAIAYAMTGRIEAAILTHFTLNAVHFIGFTYPHL